MRLFEFLAEAFSAEGVDTVFALMGDGNMSWVAAMESRSGARIVHARHEAAAVAMADGYARVTEEVAVASVTCGPGLTQILTSLTAAVRRQSPIVVFVGETPATSTYHLQALQQEPIVRAVGAEYLRLEHESNASYIVARAFHVARTQRLPVVIGVPYDLQDQEIADGTVPVPSSTYRVDTNPVAANEADVEEVFGLLQASQRPVFIAGAGAVSAGCRDQIVELAELSEAHLATTLRALNFFDGEPRDVGLAGGFASPRTKAMLANADLIVALGASLSHHTTEAGKAFSPEVVVQVDLDPTGMKDGRHVARRFIKSDVGEFIARLAFRARQVQKAHTNPPNAGISQPEVPLKDSVLVDGNLVFDPEEVARALNFAIPSTASVVCGVGHFWNFIVPRLSGREPSQYHFTFEFGAIGQAVATGIGVAVAEKSGTTVIIEGDGSLLMNIQELETIARHDVPALVIVMNDGAYGAEYHKLPISGADPMIAVFGWTDFVAVAKAMGMHSSRPTSLAEISRAVERFIEDPRPTLLDVRIDRTVLNTVFGARFGAATAAIAG